MRKILTLLLLSAFLCGCTSDNSQSGATDNSSVTLPDRIETIYENTIGTKAVAEYDGKIYTLFSADDSLSSPKTEICIYNCGEYAEKIESIVLNDHISLFDAVAVSDKGIVVAKNTSSTSWDKCTLNTISEGGMVTELCQLSGYENINKIRIVGDRIFWLATDSDRKSHEYRYTDPKTEQTVFYSHSGEVMGYYDFVSGENIVLPLEMPIAFSGCEEKLTVYGFDSSKGFYFSDYENGNFLETVYTLSFGDLTNIELINEQGDMIVTSYEFDNLALGNKSGALVECDKELNFTTSPCASVVYDGYVYLTDGEGKNKDQTHLERYYIGNVRFTNPIKAISTSGLRSEPEGCGYSVTVEEQSGDEFAITVLSLDKSYDIVYADSSMGYSSELKNKGAFYPLNDVDGVKEYLDRCFPYLREAATDKNGDIWMLPFAVNKNALVVNENYFNENENDIEFPDTAEKFFILIKELNANSQRFSGTVGSFCVDTISVYLARNDSFDTEEFRTLAPIMKECCSEQYLDYDDELISALFEMRNSVENKSHVSDKTATLFESFVFADTVTSQHKGLGSLDGLSIKSLPYSLGSESVATCSFICVNPYSDNLEKTLEYISKLANKLSESDTVMIGDSPIFEGEYGEELKKVYSGSYIRFSVPYSIYYGSFMDYFNDRITLDEFIETADRSLKAYLNE